MPPRFDLTGQKFHRLTVVGYAGRQGGPGGTQMWMCACECGTRKSISYGNLKKGLAKSCGCWNLEQIRRRNFRHGGAVRGAKDRRYIVWCHMINRCENPNSEDYKWYGERGIRICDRWRHGDGERTGYELFAADMGEPPPRHSIERIDVDGDYEPLNCKWATQKEQMQNTRRNKSYKQKQTDATKRKAA